MESGVAESSTATNGAVSGVAATANETLDVLNPATGGLIKTIAVDSPQAVTETVARVRANQAEWEAIGIEGRYHWLGKLRDWMLDNAERIGDTMQAETGKVRADATVASLLRDLGLQPTAAAQAPYLDLASAPDFARYELRYTAKARKNRRRLMRRLSEQGPFTLERYTGGAEARAAAPQAIALKREWIKHTGRVAPALADQRFAAFFADVAEGEADQLGNQERFVAQPRPGMQHGSNTVRHFLKTALVQKQFDFRLE